MNHRSVIVGGSAARIFAAWGPKPTLDKPDDLGALVQVIEQHHVEVKGALTETRDGLKNATEKAAEFNARITELEQKAARRPGPGLPGTGLTLGQVVVADQQVKNLGSTVQGRAKITIERKNITSATSTVGATPSTGTSLVPADRQSIVMLPQRRMTIRDLMIPGETVLSAIEWPVQSTFSNQAGTVVEGALKPQSDVTFDLRSASVKTLAHFMLASRQILDDAPGLQSMIDGQLRYGLQVVEENQILFGDGTGQNILGLIPQASAFAAPFAIPGPTMFDTLLQAAAQVANSLYTPTGIVLNLVDWYQMLAIKDGVGRPFSGGPFGEEALNKIWNLPKVATTAMPRGQFLIGAFDVGAQLFDRMAIEVLISTEDRDNFIRNMVTIRAEERVALAVYRPTAFVTGTFPA